MERRPAGYIDGGAHSWSLLHESLVVDLHDTQQGTTIQVALGEDLRLLRSGASLAFEYG